MYNRRLKNVLFTAADARYDSYQPSSVVCLSVGLSH